MKKILIGAMLLSMAIVVPVPTMARVDINVNIGLPPPIGFSGPPDVIVMPDTTDVYLVPDIDADLFFWNGWWWRLWEGRWYRSHYYDRSWRYYSNVPSFYYDVDPGWRGYYRDRDWYGHQWNYERIPHQRLRQNWKSWRSNRYWERQGTWGILDYRPRPQQQRQELRQQRQQLYQQRPEVQQQRQPQTLRPQVRQPRQQPQQNIIQPPRQVPRSQVQQQRQPQAQKPQVQQQKLQPKEKAQKQQKHSQPEGKPERGKEDKKDRK